MDQFFLIWFQYSLLQNFLQSKMVVLLQNLVFLQLISIYSCFPTNIWRSYTVGVDPTLNSLKQATMEISGADVIVNIAVLPNTAQNIILQRVNATPATPVVMVSKTISYGFTIATGPFVSPMQNSHLVTMSKTSGTSIAFQYSKSTLNYMYNTSVTIPSAGLYIPQYDLMMFHITSEALCANPHLFGTTYLGGFNLPTSDPFNIKYMYTKDNLYHFTFYTDKNIFLRRTLNSNVNAFASGPWTSPTQIPTPGTGYQCTCFDVGHTIIYILDNSGTLIQYDIAADTVTTIASTSYSDIQTCYFDVNWNCLMLVRTGSLIQCYDLTDETAYYYYDSAEINFYIDPTYTYISMTNQNVVNVYKISDSWACSSGNYWDSGLVQCQTCPLQCATCILTTKCTSCSFGYWLSNNLCIVNSTSANITNATANSTKNQTSSNMPQKELTIIEEFMLALINNKGLSTMNKIPASRKLLPFLCYLVNIDELWLYMYHENDYGSTMNSFFAAIQSLENEKYNIVQESTTAHLYEKIGTSREAIFEVIDTKYNYTHPTFRKMEEKGETFMSACYEFITFNFFFIFIMFIILNWGFKMLFNYKVSLYLRSFSSLVFLAPMLLEGNLQYFFFILFSQMSLGFSLAPVDKGITLANYLLYFIIIWLSIVSSFIAFYLNKKLAKYIIGNWRTRICGLIVYSLTNMVRQMILGAIHSLLRGNHLQLPLLLSVQISFILFMASIKTKMIHKLKAKMWFVVIFSYLRIILQILLYLQQKLNIVNTGSEIQRMFENMLALVIVSYLMLFYYATLWEIVSEVVEIIKDAIKSKSITGEEKKRRAPSCNNKRADQKKEEIIHKFPCMKNIESLSQEKENKIIQFLSVEPIEIKKPGRDYWWKLSIVKGKIQKIREKGNKGVKVARNSS